MPLSPKKGATSVPGTGKTVEDGGNYSTFSFQDTKSIDLIRLTKTTTGRIQFKVLPSCLAKSSDFGSALLKYYVNVQVFNVLLK